MTAAALVPGVLVASILVDTAPGDAMTHRERVRVIRVVAAKAGAPYRYGAEGPCRFDCSGLTMRVLHRIGRELPRTSRDRSTATHRVTQARRRWGDLVFLSSRGRVHHAGICAGRNRIWHAPGPGRRVQRERLRTSRVTCGRVR